MKDDIRKKFDIKEDSGGWLLLEKVVIGKRSLIAYYRPEVNAIEMSIFHSTDRPNNMSKTLDKCSWGYMTFHTNKLDTCELAAEIIGLYLKDIENDNCWWESDNK